MALRAAALDGGGRAGGAGSGCAGTARGRARRQSLHALTRSFIERIALAHPKIWYQFFLISYKFYQHLNKHKY